MLDESLRREIARLQNSGAKAESGGGNQSGEVESHVNRLLKLLKKLESINDRSDGAKSRAPGGAQDFDLLVIAALREAECADLIEKTMEADLTALCNEIKRKDEALQARETALARLKETSDARLSELEGCIQDQANCLRKLQAEQQELTAERDHLVNRLRAADLAAKQAEAHACQLKQRTEEELSALRTGKADGRVDGDQIRELEALQLRLQETEAKLVNHETDLKEKEGAIHAAGMREKELGKLIERLSAECEKLSAELCEKGLMVSGAEDKTRPFFISGGKAWGKIIGLVRAGRKFLDK